MSAALADLDLCPICRAELQPQATECPRCGEVFGELFEDVPILAEAGRPVAGRREKFLLYAGVVLILLGGPGIALGSWLHDVLRISYLNYDAFSVFGPMNRLVLAVGLIVMIVGTVFLYLSLRFSRPADTEDSA